MRNNRISKGMISVVIPCYNEGELLIETVESVENQTFTNYEIIVCNDNSQDIVTNKTCQQLASSKRIKYHRLSEQKRTAGARNEAIQRSCGEYIFTLDGDDLIDTCYLQKCFDLINCDEKIGFVYTDMILFFSNGVTKVYEKEGFNRAKVIAQGYPGAPILFRRKDYDRTKGYNENLQGQEDWEFLVQLCGLGINGAHIAEPLYYYRQKNLDNSKHRRTLISHGIETKRIVMNSNLEVFEKYSKEIIISIYEMHHQLWLSNHESSTPLAHIKWLIKWGLKKVKIWKG